MPFTMIGVNSDEDREATLRKSQAEAISWRSFWDGGHSRGPIATAWGIGSWPSNFVVDHQGRIRYRNVYGETLEAVLGSLIAAAERERQRPARD